MQKNSGHVKNTIAWTITTEAGGCTVDVKAEYEIRATYSDTSPSQFSVD